MLVDGKMIFTNLTQSLLCELSINFLAALCGGNLMSDYHIEASDFVVQGLIFIKLSSYEGYPTWPSFPVSQSSRESGTHCVDILLKSVWNVRSVILIGLAPKHCSVYDTGSFRAGRQLFII